MGRDEIMQRFLALDERGKEELLEKITFCSFADDWEFENYFRLDELEESELDCLVSFLYQQDCFLMMLDILNRYRGRFTSQGVSLFDEVNFSDRFLSRFKKLESLAEN